MSAGNATLPPEEGAIALVYLARAYLRNPPPAQFHFLVSPLVMWIWLGGLIVFGGGLIAVWPAPTPPSAGGWRPARAPARCAAWLAPEARRQIPETRDGRP